MVFALFTGLWASGCAHRESRESGGSGSPGALDASPPPGVLGLLTLGPLPSALEHLTALGRALGAWDTREDVFFQEVRALAEILSDLGPHVDWTRPAHLVLLDEKVMTETFAVVVPVEKPREALTAIAGRCRSQERDGIWSFSGRGSALLPCRFHARAVPGGLVVAPTGLLVDALGRFGHALLDPRWHAPKGDALRPDRPVRLAELRAFLPALRARFGLDAKKVSMWVDLAAMALAVAAGDFTAAADVKEELQRVVAQIDSLEDVGVSLEVGAKELDLVLFATGRPGGALDRYARGRRPSPLSLCRRIEPNAAVSLTMVGPGRRPASGLARSSEGLPPAGGSTAGAQAGADARPMLATLVDLLLVRLPEPYRAPAKRLWNAFTGPGSGELALALRRSGEGGVGLELLLGHGQPAAARRELTQACHDLLEALRKQFGASAPFRLEKHLGEALDRIDLVPGEGPGVAWAALRLLWGDSPVSVVVSHRERVVGVVIGARPEKRLTALLASAPSPGVGSPGEGRPALGGPVPPETLPSPGAGTLGRVTLSLVELGRLAPGLVDSEALPTGETGALLLQWGVAPDRRRVELRLSLPSVHLKAILPLLESFTDRAEGSSDPLGELLGVDEEAEDAL